MKIRCYDIKWDIDEDQEVTLPNEIILEIEDIDCPKFLDEFINNEVSDELSNKTGYCHDGFKYEVVKDETNRAKKEKTK